MKKAFVLVLFISFCSNLIFADDGDIGDILYTGTTNPTYNGTSSYKAKQYRSDAEKLSSREQRLDKRAPKEAQEAVKEYNELEKDLKKVYMNLANAYEKGDNVSVAVLETLSWKIKEKMKIAKQKKAFAYQINEFEKGLNEFPDSKDLKAIVDKVKQDVNNYFKYSNEILVLQTKQKNITSDISKLQTQAQIIRQKEILNKMQSEYSKSYGDNAR